MSHILDYQSSPPDGLPARHPTVELLLLAVPTITQMASYTTMQFIDTLMLTRISDAAATAASNSGMFAFSAISLGFGLLLLVNTLVSQNYGQRNYSVCGRYLWQGIWSSILFGILLLPVIPLIHWAFREFGHSPDLLRLEMIYLQIVMAAAVIKFGATAFGQFQLAIDRPNAVFISAVIGVTCNIVAAYVMIFGRFGVPALGVAGAAWGQNIGVAIELLCLIVLASRRSIRLTFNLADWRPRARELFQLLKVGIPSGVQVVAEVLAWSFFAAWVVGRFGTPAMAANTYTFRFMAVSFMPAIGIGTAVTALVGRYIGRGRPDISAHRAHLGFRIAMLYMLGCGLVFLLGRGLLIGFFTHDPQVLKTGKILLTFAAAYQVFDAMYIIYVGALRGAGDTFVPALVTGVLCWTVLVGGGYALGRFWPQLGTVGPWVAAMAYGMSLGFFMFGRFVDGRWKSIHLAERSASPSPPTSAKVPGLLSSGGQQLAADN